MGFFSGIKAVGGKVASKAGKKFVGKVLGSNPIGMIMEGVGKLISSTISTALKAGYDKAKELPDGVMNKVKQNWDLARNNVRKKKINKLLNKIQLKDDKIDEMKNEYMELKGKVGASSYKNNISTIVSMALLKNQINQREDLNKRLIALQQDTQSNNELTEEIQIEDSKKEEHKSHLEFLKLPPKNKMARDIGYIIGLIAPLLGGLISKIKSLFSGEDFGSEIESLGYDPSTYDSDNDGRISSTELHVAKMDIKSKDGKIDNGAFNSRYNNNYTGSSYAASFNTVNQNISKVTNPAEVKNIESKESSFNNNTESKTINNSNTSNNSTSQVNNNIITVPMKEKVIEHRISTEDVVINEYMNK